MKRWAIIGLVLACATCRRSPPESYWIETHGQAQLSALAASPRGVDAIGGSRDVYRYPGDYAVPWRLQFKVAARQVGASPRATYVIDEQGFVGRGTGGSIERWAYSDVWKASVVAADEQDQVFVVSEQRAYRVRGMELAALPCDGPVTAVAPTQGGVYALSTDGRLLQAVGQECRPVDAPGEVSAVSAFGSRLAVVVSGVVHERKGTTWVRLPHPMRHRNTGRQSVSVAEVALSANSLWARDSSGYVYVLSERS